MCRSLDVSEKIRRLFIKSHIEKNIKYCESLGEFNKKKLKYVIGSKLQYLLLFILLFCFQSIYEMDL